MNVKQIISNITPEWIIFSTVIKSKAKKYGLNADNDGVHYIII